MKWIQITDVIKWIAVCVAISISVYVTRDGRYLWFLRQGIIEINPAGISKATGIRKVCEMLDIPHENTFAFGDSANDLEMLAYVAHSIAMGNGTEEVKNTAEYVTRSVDEDGILHGLKHYGLI